MSGASSSGGGEGPGEEDFARLRDELLKERKPVREVRLKTSLEMEIISALFEGRKTVAELVEAVFHLDRDDPGFGPLFPGVARFWRKCY